MFGKRFRFLSAAAVTVLYCTSAWADMVIDWNAIAATVTITNAGRPPGAALIDMTYVHAAIYDAVNAIDGCYTVYAVTPDSSPAGASQDAAAATAAYKILSAFYPSQQAFLDTKYAASLATVPEGFSKTQGIAIGEEVAEKFLALRNGDGRNAPITYTPGSGPGAWQPTPPAFPPAQTPWIAYLRPFAMNSPSQFRTDGPPALGSVTWAEDYNEVKLFGSATGSARTPEQTEIGRFYTEHTGAQYSRIIREFAAERQLNLADNARLFAMVYLSCADALIGVWDSKFHFGFWRPVTAIRAGDTDGNPDTEPDPSWTPLATTPTHPEYPAAHGAFTGALAAALENFFGTKDVTITLSSRATGTNRIFFRTDDLVKEIIEARIYGGMHYRTSGVHGKNIGRKAADWLAKHYLQPVE